MATAEINDRLNERLKERERIARDLHDTLLQGFNGIMLRFQAVLKQIPKDQRAHGTMEEALNRADEVLLEGRERVRSLRFVTPSSTALQEALETCGRELSQDHKSEFSISTVGSPRILKPIVQDEVFQIAREALSNAFRHSKASKIEVEITYTRREFQLRIRDDGDGMDPTVAETGRPGHWGILGMRERANQAGGQLRIWSSRGIGVEVDFVISGNVAYLPAHDTPFSRNLQSAFKRRGQEK
jgi:signal transduction histidine kinase